MANARQQECYDYKGDGILWFTVYVDGKRRRISTRTAVKKEAEKIRLAHQERERRADLFGPQEVLTFGAAVGHYFRAGKSDRFVAPLHAKWENTLVRDLNAGVIKQGAIDLYPGRKPGTWIRQVITPTLAVINHCAELNLCSPMKVSRKDRSWKVARQPKQAVDRDYIEKMVEVASQPRTSGKGRDASTPHLAALILFLYTTGIRIGAACALTWEKKDLDLQRAQATVGIDKNGDAHVVALVPELVARLANLERRGSRVFGYAARSIYKMLKKVADEAGLDYIPPHQLGRHSFATELLDSGCSVADVMKLGNWKSPAMVLEIYAHSRKDRVATINNVFGAKPKKRKATGTSSRATGTQLTPARRKAM